eukprot:1664390-Pleurochrysis_carterae.AAC.1
MVRSWRVALPVRHCTFAGLLVDGEAGRERGLDAEAGGDGGGSGNGGPKSAGKVEGAASADGAVVVL